jgi:hypothetical protein
MAASYAAIGVSATDKLVKLSVSPVLIVFDALRAALNRKFPAVLLSHTLMWVTTSPFVPAHDDHDGVLLLLIDPADAAENVTSGRVVTELALEVPADPGSPVCNLQ